MNRQTDKNLFFSLISLITDELVSSQGRINGLKTEWQIHLEILGSAKAGLGKKMQRSQAVALPKNTSIPCHSLNCSDLQAP